MHGGALQSSVDLRCLRFRLHELFFNVERLFNAWPLFFVGALFMQCLFSSVGGVP